MAQLYSIGGAWPHPIVPRRVRLTVRPNARANLRKLPPMKMDAAAPPPYTLNCFLGDQTCFHKGCAT